MEGRHPQPSTSLLNQVPISPERRNVLLCCLAHALFFCLIKCTTRPHIVVAYLWVECVVYFNLVCWIHFVDNCFACFYSLPLSSWCYYFSKILFALQVLHNNITMFCHDYFFMNHGFWNLFLLEQASNLTHLDLTAAQQLQQQPSQQVSAQSQSVAHSASDGISVPFSSTPSLVQSQTSQLVASHSASYLTDEASLSNRERQVCSLTNSRTAACSNANENIQALLTYFLLTRKSWKSFISPVQVFVLSK